MKRMRVTLDVDVEHTRGPEPSLADTAKALEGAVHGLGEIGFGVDVPSQREGQAFASAHVRVIGAVSL